MTTYRDVDHTLEKNRKLTHMGRDRVDITDEDLERFRKVYMERRARYEAVNPESSEDDY